MCYHLSPLSLYVARSGACSNEDQDDDDDDDEARDETEGGREPCRAGGPCCWLSSLFVDRPVVGRRSVSRQPHVARTVRDNNKKG